MKKIQYCKKCILPNTRPNLFIEENDLVCSVCSNVTKKIDWKKRKKEFLFRTKKLIKNNKNIYDCLIPVSGGKDSTWQVLVALENNLKPLCVTWKSPARNLTGQKNLNNLISLGVDHIDFTVNPKIERYFTLKTFKRFGNPLIPMHMAIHALSVNIAIEKNIKLIIWGENSADEYGGRANLKGKYMNNEWRKYYGVTNGTKIVDWYDNRLNKKNTNIFNIPSQKKIKKNKITEIFLGHFFKWDPKKIYKISKKAGFTNLKKPKTGIYDFADIDDDFLVTIHHYMKWYKFGFDRVWDNLSIEIRNKRMTRNKAIKILKKKGNEKPIKEIKKFCDYVGINENLFYKICNKHRNNRIWFKNKNKTWQINDFLIKNWKWQNEI